MLWPLWRAPGVHHPSWLSKIGLFGRAELCPIFHFWFLAPWGAFRMLSPDLGHSISDFAAKLLGATPSWYSFEISLVLRDKMLAKILIFGFWHFGAFQVLSRMIGSGQSGQVRHVG